MKYQMAILVMLLVVQLFPNAGSAAPKDGFEGVWDVSGTNMAGKGEYKAKLRLRRTEDVYNVIWQVSESEVYLGTGVRKGNFLAVAYTDKNKSWFGVVLYTLKDKTLSGDWSMFGATRIGHERAVRVADLPPQTPIK